MYKADFLCIQKHTLKNAYLIVYFKIKICFRRKAVQSRTNTVANIKGMNKVFLHLVKV